MSKHFVRSLKNITNGYSSVEVQVRNATSNEPWGPSSSEMSEIALLTYHDTYVYEIANILEKRLRDKGKNWRHVLKSLTIILYCLVEGSDVFASEMRKSLGVFQALRTFRHVNSRNIDQGGPIREKAASIKELLQNEDKLKQGKREYHRIRREMGTPGILDLQDGARSKPRNSGSLARVSASGSRASMNSLNSVGSGRDNIINGNGFNTVNNVSSGPLNNGNGYGKVNKITIQEPSGSGSVTVPSSPTSPLVYTGIPSVVITSSCPGGRSSPGEFKRASSVEAGRYSLSIPPLQSIQEEFDGSGETLARIVSQVSQQSING